MKRKIFLVMAIFSLLFSMVTRVNAQQPNLIKNMEIHLKEGENPKRLEVIFDLAEPIDLAQGNADIIYEYYRKNADGELEWLNYKKDKSWSGYLNSYDNYPSGEHKYSSGEENNTAYSDSVPAGKIYTSVKTNTTIDVTQADAVKVTVIKGDGTGEKAVINIDGSVSGVETVHALIAEKDEHTGITLETTSGEVPPGTVLKTDRITGGDVYDTIKELFKKASEIVAFELKLESDGVAVQPTGKVRIGIPIPDKFNSNRTNVYRVIEGDGEVEKYETEVVTEEGIEYATFDTDQPGTYVLAEETGNENETGNDKDKTDNEKDVTDGGIRSPKTDDVDILSYVSLICIMVIMVMLSKNRVVIGD